MNFDGIAFTPIATLPVTGGAATDDVFLTTIGTVVGSANLVINVSLSIDGISALDRTGGFLSTGSLSIDAIAAITEVPGFSYNKSFSIDCIATIDRSYLGGIFNTLTIAGIATIDRVYTYQFLPTLTIAGIAAISSPGGIAYQNFCAIEGISTLTPLPGFSYPETLSIDAVAYGVADATYIKQLAFSIDGVAAVDTTHTYVTNPTLTIIGIASYTISSTEEFLLAVTIDGISHIDIENLYNRLTLYCFSTADQAMLRIANGTEPVGAVGSLSAVCTGVFKRTITQTLSLTQSLGHKKPTEIFQTLITLTQQAVVQRIRFGNITQTLTLTQVAEASRPVLQALALTQSVTKTKVLSQAIAQTLALIQSTARQAIISRSLSDTLIFNPPLIQRTGLGQFQYTINPASFILVPTKCLVILSVPGRSIILPCPQFGDSNTYSGTINLKRTMTGDTFTYVRKVDLEKLKYTFHMGTNKAIELKDFLLNFSDKQITLINWLGETWIVNLANNPYQFNAAGRWQNKGERYEISLEFEGIKVTI